MSESALKLSGGLRRPTVCLEVPPVESGRGSGAHTEIPHPLLLSNREIPLLICTVVEARGVQVCEATSTMRSLRE